MDYIDQMLYEVEALAINNAEKGIAPTSADVALESFFLGAEDLNTPQNRARLSARYNIMYRRHSRVI